MSYIVQDQSLQPPAVHSVHIYEVRPRKDKRGVDLISEALPENENDRPKRLFQDHGLDLCQTVRGLASAIYLDKPA